MRYLPYDHARAASILGYLLRGIRQRVAGVLSPRERRPFLSSRQRRGLSVIALVIAIVVQVVLLWLLGELVDLSISLMELWAELARKHLELTV